jgi:hypothetical protein
MMTRIITLPRGGKLEIEMDPTFLDHVCRHFGLSAHSEVTDAHLRMFIWGATKNAIDNVETMAPVAVAG